MGTKIPEVGIRVDAILSQLMRKPSRSLISQDPLVPTSYQMFPQLNSSGGTETNVILEPKPLKMHYLWAHLSAFCKRFMMSKYKGEIQR